nr:hypothetical protein [Myxococcota bacterium]
AATVLALSGLAARRRRSAGHVGGAGLVALALLSGLALGATQCKPSLVVEQVLDQRPGFQEPNTPGSGDALEFTLPAGGTIEQILGKGPDLNQVDTVRTRVVGATSPPRIVMILIPGFLGGAGTFDPLARDLVREFAGQLEVWAVNRRSQQVEDRRGGLHARAGAEAGQDDAEVFQALSEGVRFYFPTADTDRDGTPDGGFTLPDAVPGDGPSGFQRLSQDDLRFAAHWGVDTYVRDWRELVLEARALVGDDGLVLFGGHSMGTTWTGVFAAYDFDIGPGVEAGYQLVDGLLLLEGGGTRGPSSSLPTEAEYLVAIDDFANGTNDFLFDQDPATDGCQNPVGCSNDIFLGDLFGFIDAVELGAAGELNGVAGAFQPDADSILQTTPIFGGFPVSVLLSATMTNRALPGFFLDDDFSTNAAFSASIGFSANGSNVFNTLSALVPGDFYLAADEGFTRTWINIDSPRFQFGAQDALTCPPLEPPPAPFLVGQGTGCAIINNGPKPGPGEPPARWGLEREVTDIDVLIRTLYETGNASEWYFVSGRPGMDLDFGRDASALGRPDLLNTTQNANVDVPILGIGGSNGLAPTESSFSNYLQSTASTDTEVVILEGYSHVDPLSAQDNEAVPPIVDWANRLLQEKLLQNF